MHTFKTFARDPRTTAGMGGFSLAMAQQTHMPAVALVVALCGAGLWYLSYRM
jgi:hypothetical protein